MRYKLTIQTIRDEYYNLQCNAVQCSAVVSLVPDTVTAPAYIDILLCY